MTDSVCDSGAREAERSERAWTTFYLAGALGSVGASLALLWLSLLDYLPATVLLAVVFAFLFAVRRRGRSPAPLGQGSSSPV